MTSDINNVKLEIRGTSKKKAKGFELPSLFGAMFTLLLALILLQHMISCIQHIDKAPYGSYMFDFNWEHWSPIFMGTLHSKLQLFSFSPCFYVVYFIWFILFLLAFYALVVFCSVEDNWTFRWAKLFMTKQSWKIKRAEYLVTCGWFTIG